MMQICRNSVYKGNIIRGQNPFFAIFRNVFNRSQISKKLNRKTRNTWSIYIKVLFQIQDHAVLTCALSSLSFYDLVDSKM